MKLPIVTIKELLEAGVHLGHKTFRWNPKMSKFIFGSKDSIHIIDLVQTLEMTNSALQEIHKLDLHREQSFSAVFPEWHEELNFGV